MLRKLTIDKYNADANGNVLGVDMGEAMNSADDGSGCI